MKLISPERSRFPALAIWLVLILVALFIISTRLSFSYNLGLFLPQPQTLGQEVLVERLGDSPGSRYILIALSLDEPGLVELVARLKELESLETVLSDLSTDIPDGVPEPIWSHRYLLADTDWSTESLGLAFRQRLSELGMTTDAAFENMVRHDPTLTALGILEPLSEGREGAWLTPEGQRILVAVSSAPAFDISGQQRAVDDIKSVVQLQFSDAENVEFSGAGVFGVDLRQTIQREATWRSLWASVALILVLLLAYRSIRVIVVSALPLFSALVLGLLGVTLAFGEVHGITLAFGFTLMGVAIDYPLHYLSHARHQSYPKAMANIWPTLRLSAISTALAYLALLVGGAEGMAQLGLFSALGVVGALLTTRWVVPVLAWGVPPGTRPRQPVAKTANPFFQRIARPTLMAVAVLLIVWQSFTPDWWSNDLSALSPIPAEQLERDGELRQAIGAPSMRHQVVLREQGLESLLEKSEQLDAVLFEASQNGLLAGYSSIGRLLPSKALQKERQDRIPAQQVLQERVENASDSLPFTATAFLPFIEDSARNKHDQPIGLSDFVDTPLEDALNQFLIPPAIGQADSWTSLVTLADDFSARSLGARLEERMPEALLVDYRAASEELVADYRYRTGRVLAAVLVLITVLLLWQVQWKRGLVCVFLVVVSILCTASLLRAFYGPLNLYHMMGLLLVAGIGLDYTLFLTRREPDSRDTRHAVFTCAASTVAAFGVLAFSAIPALQSLGSSVSIGALICVLAAWLSPGMLDKRQKQAA